MSGFNDTIIAEFRDNAGHVETNGFGSRLVLLHSTGAKSGEERTNPVMALRDGDGWLVVASKGGAPTNPDWLYNLRAHPEAWVETPPTEDGGAIESYDVRASELPGEERTTAFQKFVDVAPGFGEYEKKAGGRVIPVLRLSPR